MTVEQMSPAVRQDVENSSACRVCLKFDQVRRALGALADADAVPASTYFRVGALMTPAQAEHKARRHPALFAFEQEQARQRAAALGIVPEQR